MRTQEEIVKRYRQRSPQDLFGFEADEYLAVLDYQHAEPFLKDGVTPEKWEETALDGDPEQVKDRMLGYMPFAWQKASDCRGISACRSISHFIAWVWLTGEEPFATRLQEAEDLHNWYGKNLLAAICEHYGWDWSAWDYGGWREGEGEPALTEEQVRKAVDDVVVYLNRETREGIS